MPKKKSTKKPGPVKLYEDQPTREMNKRVKGAAGTKISGGEFEEDYNTKLRGTDGVAIYEEMRRGDPVIASFLNAIKLPILRCEYKMVAADDSKEAERLKDIAEWQILKHLDKGWTNLLREILSCVDFGFSIFELVWENNGRAVDTPFGKLPVIHDLDLRHQHTISDWNMDEEKKDRLVSVTQKYTVEGEYKEVTIPIKNLVIFSINKEGANWEGISLLRPCYKPWYHKDKYERIEGMSLERFGMGFPVLTMQESPTEDQRSEYEKLVDSIITHKQAGAVLPFGATLALDGLGGRVIPDLSQPIQRYKDEIKDSLLQSFVGLGGNSTPVGSYALHKSAKNLFLSALEALMDQVLEICNKYWMRHLMHNLGETDQEIWPHISYEDVSDVDVAMLVDQLVSAKTAGLIHWKPEDEQTARKALQITDFDLEELKKDFKEDEKKEKKQEKLNQAFQQSDQQFKAKAEAATKNGAKPNDLKKLAYSGHGQLMALAEELGIPPKLLRLLEEKRKRSIIEALTNDKE